MLNLGSLVSLLALLLAALTASGGAIFIRRLYASSLSAVQDRVIKAQQEENALLNARIRKLRADVADAQDTLTSLRALLRRRGIVVRVEGDYITLVDAGSPKETSAKIVRTKVSEAVLQEGGQEYEVEGPPDGSS